MRITALTVKNFKRLRSLDIDADRAIIILGGKNGSGKTSALDAIQAALTGERSIPAEPIKRGEDKGEIVVKLDDFTVTRSFARKDDGAITTALKIATADGMKPASPQAWLNAKIGDLTCDPLAFMAAKPDAQAERLRKIAGVDTTALDRQRAILENERLDIGRAGKGLAESEAAMPHYTDAPAEVVVPDVVSPEIVSAPVVSAADIVAELAAADATQRVKDESRRLADEKARLHTDAERKVSESDAKIEQMKRDLDAETERRAAWAKHAEHANQLATAAEEGFAALPVTDRAPIAERLATVEQTNAAARDEAAAKNAEAVRLANEANAAARKLADDTNARVRANAARKAKGEEAEASRRAWAGKTTAIKAVDAERAAMLAAAPFPVAGLGFGTDGGVTFNGLPLAQASGAEQIRVSMGIALAANPTIRVVLIRDASLLDEDSMALVVDLAEKADAQVWLERVGSGDAGAVVISDGGVVS
jgi:chemotaxis protein histidine kinase CheA